MLHYLKTSKRTIRVRKYVIYLNIGKTDMSKMGNTQHPKVEIAVENFGPIAEANIDLRPLTVFVGPSNTGKTYFATLTHALNGVFPNITGPRFLFPSGFDGIYDILEVLLRLLVFKNDHQFDEETFQDVIEKLSRGDRAFRLSDLPPKIQELLWNTIDYSYVFGDKLQTELKNYFDVNSIPDLNRLTEKSPSDMTVSLMVGEEHEGGWHINTNASGSDVTFSCSFNEGMIILPEGLAISSNWTDKDNLQFTFKGNLKFDFSEDFVSNKPGELEFDWDTKNHSWKEVNRYYLPAARSGIMQSHRVIATSLVKRSTRVGLERFHEVPTMSGVIADFMERIILYEDSKVSNDIMNHIAETLENEVLSGQIRVKSSGSGYPDFRYLPHDSNEEFRLSQSSSMVSELAPLILYLRGYVQPGDTLIIEEPEAHLHPGAQADMAVILARLVRAGVRVIITTHSDWLLQEIGNLILEGLIDEKTDEQPSWLLPEEVGAWHFQKDEPVKEIAFHPRKGFSPKDYQDVAESLYNRSVNLQQKYEKQEGESKRECT